MATAFAAALPRPKHVDDAASASTAHQHGIRVLGPNEAENLKIAPRESRAPPYGQRKGWRPRTDGDYADGGAFPEIAVAQYPHGMGKQSQQTSNALTLSVNRDGQADHAGAIARRGHNSDRIIHSSFSSLIPSRSAGMQLDRPNQDQVEDTRKRTEEALQKIITGSTAAQKAKNVKTQRAEPQYVQYTSADQMGDGVQGRQRLIKIVETQKDPMEPPKHKHKRIPGRAPSPPPPIMHSPPRKVDAKTQQAWHVPPSVSNWKNPKGYTVPLDKRLAADGRGLQDVSISDKFAQLSESLSTADRHIREEVHQRQLIQQKLGDREREQKEQHLRELAQKARADRSAMISSGRDRPKAKAGSQSPRRSVSSYSDSASEDSEEEARREREKARRERQDEDQRDIRQSRMGRDRRIQNMAREQNRDISEKVALGLAKPTKSAEAMYDSRLFNQTSSFATGFNEDQAYDKPLFAERDAINSIYRPSVNAVDDEEEAGAAMDQIQKSSRFDTLGKAGTGKGFAGTEGAEQREGPVEFEKHTADPFGIDAMIKETVGAQAGEKRYGMQKDGGRPGKRARVDNDHD